MNLVFTVWPKQLEMSVDFPLTLRSEASSEVPLLKGGKMFDASVIQGSICQRSKV